MNLENIPLEIGQTVFFPKDTVAGKKYKPASVITIYEVGVAEVEIVTGTGDNKKIKRQKFAVKDLRRSEPPKEVAS